MSVAEFVLAFVGIIIGLGVADVLVSLHGLLRAGRRVKWHWATPALAALMLLVSLVLWWQCYYLFGGLTSETIAGFLPNFLLLVVAFLMMAAALPDEVPADGIDLKQYYLSTRVHQWTLMSAALGGGVLLVGAGKWHINLGEMPAESWLPITSFVIAVMAAFISSMRFHAFAIGWIFAVTLHRNLFTAIGQ